MKHSKWYVPFYWIDFLCFGNGKIKIPGQAFQKLKRFGIFVFYNYFFHGMALLLSNKQI